MPQFKASKPGYLLPLLVLMLGLTLPARIEAQESTDTLLTTGTFPQTDGATVVWDNDPRGHLAGDIYAANIRERRAFPVTTTPGDTPDIDNGVVVWIEHQRCGILTCYTAVHGKDLGAKREFLIDEARSTTEHVETTRLAISGKYVVWERYSGGTSTLQGRDIGAMAPVFTLASIRSGAWTAGLRISGDYVVWGEQYPVDVNLWSWRVLGMRIGTHAPTMIAEGSGGVGKFGYDFEGDTVVYVTPEGYLFRVNLKTGERNLVAANAASPTTDGRYVFWEDRPSGNIMDEQRVDLRGHDLDMNIDFSVSVNTGRNYAPQTKGGVLVWQRQSENPTVVHAVRVAEILPHAPRPAPTTPSPNVSYFPETSHTLASGFKAFWEGNGGLPVFGYPLTEEFDEVNQDIGKRFTVQYVERQRFEYHPENANTPYIVLLGRLGVEALQRQGRDWQTFPKAAPDTPHFFAQTGHAIAPQFWDYWRSHGLELGDQGVTEREALALFGYPISEPQIERNTSGDTALTQWFERACFEYHPDNPQPYQVLLGRLGADALAQRGW